MAGSPGELDGRAEPTDHLPGSVFGVGHAQGRVGPQVRAMRSGGAGNLRQIRRQEPGDLPVADRVHDLGRRDHDRVDVGEVGDRRTACGLVSVEIIASSKTAHSVVCRGRQAGRVTVTALIVAHCG